MNKLKLIYALVHQARRLLTEIPNKKRNDDFAELEGHLDRSLYRTQALISNEEDVL